MTAQLRRRLSSLRRRAFEACRSDRYSRPALHEIDRKLERYLDFQGGFFVEAGANDGIRQSNTYYLEKIRGWSGVLVEPMPELHRRCVALRTHSKVYRCALVADDFTGDTVTMHYANLMSLVEGARRSPAAEQEHLRRGAAFSGVAPYQVEVPARTLSSILDQAGVGHVDLLSLDVEGYEHQALRGLDLDRYRPSYILVEANFRRQIDRHLAAFGYTPIDELSHHDVLYLDRRVPGAPCPGR